MWECYEWMEHVTKRDQDTRWVDKRGRYAAKSITVLQTRGADCICGELGNENSAPWDRHAHEAA